MGANAGEDVHFADNTLPMLNAYQAGVKIPGFRIRVYAGWD